MHPCHKRILAEKMKCQFHIDSGVIDFSINEGTCEKCLFYQEHGIDIKRASLTILGDYINGHIKNIKLYSREEANKLFDTAFTYYAAVQPRQTAIESLSTFLIEFSKSPHVKEEDIERIFNEFRRFEENS